jgi:hypothetical protein
MAHVQLPLEAEDPGGLRIDVHLELGRLRGRQSYLIGVIVGEFMAASKGIGYRPEQPGGGRAQRAALIFRSVGAAR